MLSVPIWIPLPVVYYIKAAFVVDGIKGHFVILLQLSQQSCLHFEAGMCASGNLKLL